MTNKISGYILAKDVGEKGPICESGKGGTITKWLKKLFNKKGSEFECPAGTVLVGRKHCGDENGDTYYRYGTPVFVFDEENASAAELIQLPILYSNTKSSNSHKESDCDINCDTSKHEVFTGRVHEGDENGYTAFLISQLSVKSNGKIMSIQICSESESITINKESNGSWAEKVITLRNTDYNLLMTGFKHKGDENKSTTYTFTKYKIIIEF